MKLLVLSLRFLACVSLAALKVSAQSWPQLGADIDGEAAVDYSGSSVSLSMDGSRVAVGAFGNDGSGVNQAGHVRIFEYSAGTWIQLGADIDGEAAGDWSGSSVSLSADGSRVAVGAPYNDGSGSDAGHVRIFEYAGGSWIQLGADIDGEAAGDYSGWAVSLSTNGSRVAVGAPSNDGNGESAGHVRIYEYAGGNWSQLGADIDGETTGDYSGWAVSLSTDGSRVATGAFANSAIGRNAGHVRIYEYGGGNWSQLGADIDGEVIYDWSGRSVSLNTNGSRVAVGAPNNDDSEPDAGHVRIFEYTGGSWIQLGADIDGETAGDRSGSSVSLNADGSRIAVGAYGNDGSGSGASHVRVYEYAGGSWMQLGTEINGEAVDDQSGRSVSLSADGSRVAVGAPYNDGNGESAGHVRIFALMVDDDGDGLSNAEELQRGTDPYDPDSDGDGFDDYCEVMEGLSPTNDNSSLVTYIMDNQPTFGLYTEEQLGAMAIGDLMIQSSNSDVYVDLQLMKSDDLVTWTNAGGAVEWSMPAGDKEFYKVRAEP